MHDERPANHVLAPLNGSVGVGELRRQGADEVPDLDAAFLAHRRHMMHGYLNILTPVEMQPDRFAVSMGQHFAAAMEDLDTLGSLSEPRSQGLLVLPASTGNWTPVM